MGEGTPRDIGVVAQTPPGLVGVGLWLTVPGDVEDRGSRGERRERGEHAGMVVVPRGGDSAFTEIVPAGPHEVPQRPRRILGIAPGLHEQFRGFLTADHHTPGMELMVGDHTDARVVVAGHIKLGVGIPRLPVDDRFRDDPGHQTRHRTLDHVHKQGHTAVGCLLPALPGLRRLRLDLVFVSVSRQVQKTVDAVGDRPGGVQRPDLVGDGLVPPQPGLDSRRATPARPGCARCGWR